MKNKFLPIIAIMAIAAFFIGMYTQDPTSSRTPNIQPLNVHDPIVPQTNAVVKYVDSLNGANDTVALRSRGYIPKRGPLAGPPGTLPNWFQGNPTNWNAFNGPTSGYVSANFNCVTSGTQDLWLILPPVNTAAGDTISFYERSVAGNTFPDSTRVYYAANGDTVPGSGSFVELGKFLNSIGGAWVERRFVAPTAGANGRWAINYRVANGGPPGANGNLIGIDYIRILGPAPALNTTLLLVHDSTVVTTQARRKQDRDSMRTYLGGLVGSYDVMTFDTNTTLPSLTQYSRIIVQETAFDAIQCRYLGLGARNALIAWLNTGSPSAKKYLYNIGGDLGYNYSRTASFGYDLNFSGTICGYTYRVDNTPGGPGTIVGVTIDVGNTRNIQTPGSNYYPDGCSISNGSLALYRHGNRTALDTLAALGRVTANYDVRSLFCDPAYFPSNFQLVLAALLGNSLVGITPVGNTIPQVYTLSQNYPNPFNPVTNIKFGIPQSGNVKLVVFDILGREVATLVNEFKTSGNYIVDFNASYLASGAYFYRLEAGNFTETKKMLLVK
jgi:hypothetical protein